jgi:hypothetical protein
VRRYLRSHFLLVFGGTAIGLTVGIFVIDVQPAFIGWLVGGGIGLSGGAYLAAITSGEPLAGGGSTPRSNWTLEDLYGDEESPAKPRSGNGS